MQINDDDADDDDCDDDWMLKVKGLNSCTCYSATYKQSQQRFTISQVAADMYELMIMRTCPESLLGSAAVGSRTPINSYILLYLFYDLLITSPTP